VAAAVGAIRTRVVAGEEVVDHVLAVLDLVLVGHHAHQAAELVFSRFAHVDFVGNAAQEGLIDQVARLKRPWEEIRC